MLGFILVSSKNRVLLIDGDESFKNYLIQRVEVEIRQPLELASTSSGIVTDLVESLTPIRKRSKRLSSVRFSLDEVSHLLLPMISLYRGSVATGDHIEFISTGENRVTFRSFANRFLIILIAKSTESAQLIEDFQRSLDINLGPLVEVLDNDYINLKIPKENVIMNISKQIKGVKVFHDAVDIRKTIFHKSLIQKLFPIIKSVCTQLQLFLGSNRCLLLCDKNILLSTHSSGNDKPLTRYLYMRDLRGLVEQVASQPGELRKPEITQLWIRSKSSLVPFFVNIVRYKMTNSLTLVCIHPTKADRFIRLVVLIIMQLERLNLGNEIERITKEISENVNELTIHLQEFVVESKDAHNDSPFLRNPLRSAQYFKGLWTKLSGDLNRVVGSTITAKQNHRISLSSLKSAISSFTLVASTLSLRNNNGKLIQELPLKTDVQLNQWRRQLISLLHELCNLARKDALSYKLTLFHNSVKSIIIKPHHERLISECSMKIAQAEMQFAKFLRPIDNKLDMLGFCLKDNEKNLEIPYETDDLKKHLPHWRTFTRSENYCVEVVSNTGRGFTIYQINGKKYFSKTSGLKSLLGTPPPAPLLSPELTITVVFDCYVHKELATKQIYCLISLLRPQMTDSSIYFF